jgi:hypothetical protein
VEAEFTGLPEQVRHHPVDLVFDVLVPGDDLLLHEVDRGLVEGLVLIAEAFRGEDLFARRFV